MSLYIPEEKRLKRFPLELQKQSDLYLEMLSLSSIMLDVKHDESVGIMLEESIGEDTSQAVVVTNTGHRYTYGSHLIFDKVVSSQSADRWVAVFQINDVKVCTGVVFVNDSGMRIEITQAGDIHWSFKEIRCSNFSRTVAPLTLASVT